MGSPPKTSPKKRYTAKPASKKQTVVTRQSNATLGQPRTQLEKEENILIPSLVHSRASVGPGDFPAHELFPQHRVSHSGIGKDLDQMRTVQKARSIAVTDLEAKEHGHEFSPASVFVRTQAEDPGCASASVVDSVDSKPSTADLQARRTSVGTTDMARPRNLTQSSASKKPSFIGHQANVRVVARVRPPSKLETVLAFLHVVCSRCWRATWGIPAAESWKGTP